MGRRAVPGALSSLAGTRGEICEGTLEARVSEVGPFPVVSIQGLSLAVLGRRKPWR